jgi:glycine/D-amino acid oxidase-like deaminating enzyme
MSNPTDTPDITVIGGGIVGIVTALTLCRDGHDVTVIDEMDARKRCSFGNGGAIGPDSCTPMAMPGMLAKIPKWLFDKGGPISVDWRYLPRTLPWLLRWLGASGLERARTSSMAMRAMHQPSLEIYRNLLGAEHYGDLVRTTGNLYVYESAEPSKSELIGRQLQREQGVQPETLTADDVRNLEPALAPIFKRGVMLRGNVFTVNPSRFLRTLTEQFLATGGKLVEGRVMGFDMAPSGPRAVLTEAGSLSVDKVVVSAGAWSGQLTGQLGTRVPLEAERGYHVTLPDAGIELRNKVMNGTHSFGLTPMEDGLQITGTVEIANVNAAPNPERAEALLNHGRRMLPGLKDVDASTWMGCRPSLPDSLPIVSRSPHLQNVFFAFGHSHWGLSGAPMTGQIIAAMINGREPPICPHPYRIGRF